MLALVVVAILGPRTENVVLALTLVYLPRVARLVRGTVLAVREFEYVAAGVALGASSVRIIARYLLPNVIAPLIVQATFIYGYAILGEASLSFLGVGTSPPTPSLGNILSDARPMLREAPWLALFPAATIALTIFGFNLLGDGLRDVLDPRTTGRRS
jgi:peptide/nickel transport system permease protein